MAVLKSFIYSLKAARCSPVTVVHGLLYAATVTYLRVLRFLVRSGSQSFLDHLVETYHGKVLRLEDARKIITVNRDIELKGLEQVLPYRHAQSIILLNPLNIAVYECPCRAQKKDPCQPTDVCLVVGDPFVDLLRMFQPFRSRRITQAQALEILREEDLRGHVHTAWFKKTMLDRFYAICNCCRCCCLGMKFMAEHKMNMLLPSGYSAVAGAGCIGCGLCVRSCQFDALAMVSAAGNGSEGKKCRVNSEKCFGCGVCENKCAQKAIMLVLDSGKGVPLDIEVLAEAASHPDVPVRQQ
jgi:formate hydrogenlyase subunit 6/NADH:ubiquinone oxidoreductase subunit I